MSIALTCLYYDCKNTLLFSISKVIATKLVHNDKYPKILCVVS